MRHEAEHAALDAKQKMGEADRLQAKADKVKETASSSEGTAKSNTDAQSAAAKCQENMSRIDGAKEQWALEYKKPNGSTVTWQNLLDPENSSNSGTGYLKKEPSCPGGGTYSISAIGTNPECSVHGKLR